MRAVRTPFILLAATDAPTPLLQTAKAFSTSMYATALASGIT